MAVKKGRMRSNALTNTFPWANINNTTNCILESRNEALNFPHSFLGKRLERKEEK